MKNIKNFEQFNEQHVIRHEAAKIAKTKYRSI